MTWRELSISPLSKVKAAICAAQTKRGGAVPGGCEPAAATAPAPAPAPAPAHAPDLTAAAAAAAAPTTPADATPAAAAGRSDQGPVKLPQNPPVKTVKYFRVKGLGLRLLFPRDDPPNTPLIPQLK